MYWEGGPTLRPSWEGGGRQLRKAVAAAAAVPAGWLLWEGPHRHSALKYESSLWLAAERPSIMHELTLTGSAGKASPPPRCFSMRLQAQRGPPPPCRSLPPFLSCSSIIHLTLCEPTTDPKVGHWRPPYAATPRNSSLKQQVLTM